MRRALKYSQLDVTASSAELSSGRGGNRKNTLLKEHSLMCMKVSAGTRSGLNAARGLLEEHERAPSFHTGFQGTFEGTSSESWNHNYFSINNKCIIFLFCPSDVQWEKNLSKKFCFKKEKKKLHLFLFIYF